MRKRKIKQNLKYRRRRFCLASFLILVVVIIVCHVKTKKKEPIEQNENFVKNTDNLQNLVEPKQIEIRNQEREIDDWRLVLVNYENALPSDFEPELANIDKIRQFDTRAIDELNQMMNQMKQDGITNVWIQSGFRSVEKQEDVFEQKIKKYMAKGKSREEAENLVLQTINKPGTSEHNLGLAIDFNYVDYDFDQTKGFKWLVKNAQNYGFILRYEKEKETITKVDYEPWHWRYVGKEHAVRINELQMCLEEYIEHLKSGQD